MYVYIYVLEFTHECRSPWWPEMSGPHGDCELPKCRYWQLNSGPLQEQEAPLTAEPPHQPLLKHSFIVKTFEVLSPSFLKCTVCHCDRGHPPGNSTAHQNLLLLCSFIKGFTSSSSSILGTAPWASYLLNKRSTV